MIVDDIEILMYQQSRIVIPTSYQRDIVTWYHHYLQHPGTDRLEETIKATMYWRGLVAHVRKHVKTCRVCQRSKSSKYRYGKVPRKIAVVVPWQVLCVDCIGPYTIEDADGNLVEFMCVTMVDPATGWFEMEQIPTVVTPTEKKGVDAEIFEKTSARISRIINKLWLSRYPRPRDVVYNNGLKFKLYFQRLCSQYNLNCKPTTVKNPQANGILERLHRTLGNMLRTAELEGANEVNDDIIEQWVTDAAWAVRSTYHTVLRSMPGAAIFGRDMLFDIPYIADWTKIGQHRQELVDKHTACENSGRIEHNYAIGNNAMIKYDGVRHKSKFKYSDPYRIVEVYTNGTVRIRRDNVTERIHIRRLKPYFGEVA